MFDMGVFRTTRNILTEVVTRLVDDNRLPSLPRTLYHHSSLEVLQLILEHDDVRMTLAEYSNDQREVDSEATEASR